MIACVAAACYGLAGMRAFGRDPMGWLDDTWRAAAPSKKSAPLAAKVATVVVVTGVFATITLLPILLIVIVTFRLRGSPLPAALDLFPAAGILALVAVSLAFAGVDLWFWNIAPYCLAFMAAGGALGLADGVVRRMPRRALILPALAILGAAAYALFLVFMVHVAGAAS